MAVGLNGEPHSGHVFNKMWSFEHPTMPNEHTKHLNQVVQSHSLCHIGFVESEEVYSRANERKGEREIGETEDRCGLLFLVSQPIND